MTPPFRCTSKNEHSIVNMVLGIFIGCSNHSGRDKGVSFYRIPKFFCRRGIRDYELNRKRRDEFIAAISGDNLTKKVLENDRICSRHFVFVKPAPLYDETNPGWLPTLHLGHCKKPGLNKKATERWERRRARAVSATNRLEVAKPLLTLAVSSTE